MSGFRQSPRRSFCGFAESSRRREMGEVSDAQLRRDIDRGIRHFWSSRVRPPCVDFQTRGPKRNATLAAVASTLVAMGKPPYGLMKRLAVENNLCYTSLATKVNRLRREQARQKGKAA